MTNDFGGWDRVSDDDGDLPSVDIESGEVVIEKPKRVKRQYKEVYKIFQKMLKKQTPENWLLNKTQMQAADNLWRIKGEVKIKNALQFYLNNKDNEYCPVVNSPYKLDSKWDDLLEFRKKNNL